MGRASWKSPAGSSGRRKYIEEAPGSRSTPAQGARSASSGLDQDLLRLQDVLAELRRQLKPLQQQAEMAKKHETLTEQAEELSRKLAAARLRALMRERARRKDGWDHGLEARKSARELLDGLDGQVLQASDDRAAAARGLADTEQSFRAAQAERTDADQAFRTAVERESDARDHLAAEASRTARIDGVDREMARAEQELARVITELEAGEHELDSQESEFREAEERRRQVEDVRRRMGEGGRRAPSRDGGAPSAALVVRARTGVLERGASRMS